MNSLKPNLVQEEAFRAASLAAAHRPAGRCPDMSDGTPKCRDCGDPIPAARLKALPGVGLCVGCAEELASITGGW